MKLSNHTTSVLKNFATINQNLKSYVFAILGAEYVLRWLPIGTHNWDKFLSPKDSNMSIIIGKKLFLNAELSIYDWLSGSISKKKLGENIIKVKPIIKKIKVSKNLLLMIICTK